MANNYSLPDVECFKSMTCGDVLGIIIHEGKELDLLEKQKYDHVPEDFQDAINHIFAGYRAVLDEFGNSVENASKDCRNRNPKRITGKIISYSPVDPEILYANMAHAMCKIIHEGDGCLLEDAAGKYVPPMKSHKNQIYEIIEYLEGMKIADSVKKRIKLVPEYLENKTEASAMLSACTNEYRTALSNYERDLRNNWTTDGKKIKRNHNVDWVMNAHKSIISDSEKKFLEMSAEFCMTHPQVSE